MNSLNKKIKNIIKDYYKKDEYKKNPTGYFYNLKKIENKIELLKNNLPKQVLLFYAMKANNNNEIMKYISRKEYVYGIEIASYGELQQALNYVNNKRIIFTGPGKTEYELEEAIKNRIKYINIESITEAVRINEIAKKLNINKVDILVRINLNYSINDSKERMSGISTKMGIDENECIKSMNYISKLDRINIKGIHVFAASGVLNYKSLLKSNKYIFDLTEKIENTIPIEVIDLGGGLGIDYTTQNRLFDIKEYGKGLTNLIREYSFDNKKIIMELGTYLVGDCGYYTSKIIDIKKIKNKKHIILAGGVNHMGLPLEMRRKHPVTIIEMNEKKIFEDEPFVKKEKVDISGPLCMVSDKLSWNTYIKEANIGDILVFHQSGAYCEKEGMKDFLNHFYPNIEIIKEDI